MFDADPFAYLEDLAAPVTQDFAAQADAATRARFEDAQFAAMRDDIAAQLQNNQQIALCQEHRARMYHFYQSDEWPKGVYRVCSAASYRAGVPDWDILFAVADFDAILDDDVYLQGVAHYVEAPEHVLISLSAGGGDAAYTVEFDLAQKKIVPDGFHFPLSKGSIHWRDEHSVWVCPAWDERQCTSSGYARQVWLMMRGQSFADAQPLLEMPAHGMMVNAWRYLDGQGGAIDLIEAAEGFYTKTYYQVLADGVVQALNLPDDCELMGYLCGQLLVQLRSDWQRTNQGYAAGSLVAVKLHKGVLGEAQAVFVPTATQAIDTVETTRRFVVISLLDEVRSRLCAWRFEGGRWRAVAVPRLPEGVLEITDQPWGGDVLYVVASHFTQPMILYTLDLQQMEWCVIRRQKDQFDATGMCIQQFQASSADGTLIPYFHVGHRASAQTPTVVYVYGGFGMPQLPYYLGTVGRHWLARGGALVLANVRGGGEFGPAWHRAAQGVHKHRSVDDVLAVLHDLYAHQRASVAHTALQGGSNGGLVVASAFCREPHHMGALVCEVPLTDMLQYAALGAGASWQDEYGSVLNGAEAAALQALSPYHGLAEGVIYPPALVTTNWYDDRVHPAHALKFYARLRSLGQPVWLSAPSVGGHSGSATQMDTATELALILRFLQQSIGANPVA